MATRMVTLKLDPADATLKKIRARYELSHKEVDANFGVVALDPDKNLFAILVDEQAAGRLDGRDDVVGTYSNPKIEPFGPPQK